MFKLVALVFVALLQSCSFASPTYERISNSLRSELLSDEWDYIMYSQRWPITGCEDWRSKRDKNTCNLPLDATAWTVHGLWPSKIGTNGPEDCNSAIHFDPGQLQPLMADLNQRWTNVENNTKPNSFWNHEWNKHGTCAVSLPQLNSVYNYFRQGLDWNQAYKLNDILAANSIVPNDQGYDIHLVYDTIQKELGKNPIVECVIQKGTKKSMISEIRICFNKQLELIDCNVGSMAVEDLMSNCDEKKLVMYYGSVPTITNGFFDLEQQDEAFIQQCLEEYRYREQLKRIYAIIKFIIWFTL